MTKPCIVMICLVTAAIGLLLVVLVLGTIQPGFRGAAEAPYEGLLPGAVDYGREASWALVILSVVIFVGQVAPSPTLTLTLTSTPTLHRSPCLLPLRSSPCPRPPSVG